MSTPSDKTLRLERTKLTPQPPRGGRNTTLIVAVIAGVAAAILAGIWLRGQQQGPVAPVQQQAVQPAPPPVTSPVVITTQDIPAQTVITPAMVTQSTVSPDKMKPGAMGNPAVVIGMATMKPLNKGDQIISGDVLPNQPQFTSIAGMLKPGERAMTIALDSNSSVAGFIKPGDHVDVMGTFSVGTRTITRTVLQNVELLATGAQVEWIKQDPTAQPQNQGMLASNNNDPNAPQPKPAAPQEVPNATIRVKPLDAEKLILAGSRGKLMLVLRGNTDNTQTVVPLVDATAVTTLREQTPGGGGGGYAPPPPPPVLPQQPSLPPMGARPMPVPPPAPTVTVVRGSQPTTVTVQAN